MATADLVVEHGMFDGCPHIIFRERSPEGHVVYFVAARDGVRRRDRDPVAHAYLADRDRWYWIRADGGTSSPGFDGPWLGWLLDLAREHGWEP